jgi:hypothetical protein
MKMAELADVPTPAQLPDYSSNCPWLTHLLLWATQADDDEQPPEEEDGGDGDENENVKKYIIKSLHAP